MIKLIKKNESQYRVIWKDAGINTTGTLDQTIEVLRGCNVGDDEIETALDEMEMTGDEQVTFGINRCWTYTDIQDDDDMEVA